MTTELNKLKNNRVKLGRRKRNTRRNSSRNYQFVQQKSNSKTSTKNINQRFREKWAWKKIAPKTNDPVVKKFLDKTFYWCKGHKLWCNTKHNTTNCELLKNIQTQSNKKNNNDDNSPENNNNIISFAAQIETMLNKYVWLYSSQLMTTMWLQYTLLAAIYSAILRTIIITLLITITSMFNGTSKHMKEELSNHNYTIRRNYFCIRKIMQVIMTNHNNFHICNFETTLKISKKTRYKRQSFNLKTQYY